MAKLIMLVEGDPAILAFYEEVLQEEGYRISAHALPIPLKDVTKLDPDLVITDVMFGQQLVGWKFVLEARRTEGNERLPIIICSAATANIKELSDELIINNVRVIAKPFDLADFLEKVEEALLVVPS